MTAQRRADAMDKKEPQLEGKSGHCHILEIIWSTPMTHSPTAVACSARRKRLSKVKWFLRIFCLESCKKHLSTAAWVDSGTKGFWCVNSVNGLNSRNPQWQPWRLTKGCLQWWYVMGIFSNHEPGLRPFPPRNHETNSPSWPPTWTLTGPSRTLRWKLRHHQSTGESLRLRARVSQR